MDIASLLLSFLSLLQGMRNKRTLEEKINSLKSALASLDDIYALLSLAKSIHDSYDHFWNGAMAPLADSLNNQSQTEGGRKKELHDFLARADIFLTDHALLAWKPSTLDKAGVLPVEIQNKIKQIDAVYPEFCKSVNDFTQALRQIRAAHSEENYGKSFRDNVTVASHNLKLSMTKADRIILNTAYLLDFVHFKLKDGVNTI